jgi:glucokinase
VLFRSRYLGLGIANLFNLLNPNLVVLGGGVTKSKKYFHDELISTLKQYSINQLNENSVRYSVMNDRVVLYGAYYLIAEKLKKRG